MTWFVKYSFGIYTKRFNLNYSNCSIFQRTNAVCVNPRVLFIEMDFWGGINSKKILKKQSTPKLNLNSNIRQNLTIW